MQCKEVRELMDFGLDADLSPVEASLFYGHMQSCSHCADEYAQLERMLKQIRQCPTPMMPQPQYWNDIWHQVRKRALSHSPECSWWVIHKIHLLVGALPVAAAAAALGIMLLGNQGHREMPLSEASSRHGIVLMSQPYSEPGLTMLAVSDGTVASYNSEEND